ncbi:hypothetical protein DRH14_02350 [Candidatus Shapirobacteria bacterium]|nr:MAG: hypothetical protein DRH14_02350 [Candidatus Shapirobacteria bacterium]
MKILIIDNGTSRMSELEDLLIGLSSTPSVKHFNPNFLFFFCFNMNNFFVKSDLFIVQLLLQLGQYHLCFPKAVLPLF